MTPRAVLPALVAIAVAGCGGGPSDQEQIRDTLGLFQRATAARDYRALCDRILAPRLVESVKRAGLPCEEALARGFAEVREPRLTVGRVDVQGARARAEVRSSAAGQAASEDTVELERVGKSWRIASLAGG